jgi:RecA-family ATPase
MEQIVNESKIIANDVSQNRTEDKKEKKERKSIFTGEELLNMNISELPYLLEGIIPQVGVVALAGSSDTGKSSFLRQLAAAIVKGDEDFLGFKLNLRFKNAIFVSTEDDYMAMAYLLNKQKQKDVKPEAYKGLRYIFDTEDVLTDLTLALMEQPADCIFIDTFTDLYDGEMNATNKIRNYINKFRDLAMKYNCTVIFLHHTGKKTEYQTPSKDNLLGSVGFEGKMRLVIELRQDYNIPGLRHLCLVKGNYIKSEDKKDSYILSFDNDMIFTNTGRRAPFTTLAKSDLRKVSKLKKKGTPELVDRVKKLKAEGKSIRDIEKQLKEEGHKVGKTSVGNWLKEDCPSVHLAVDK